MTAARSPKGETSGERVHLRRNWESIPLDVAQSMAEPVPVEKIRATHARIEPPALLKPRTVS